MNETTDETEEPKISAKQRRRIVYARNTDMRAYHRAIKSVLTTTRFDNTTWNENYEYRKNAGIGGCIYGTPEPVSAKITDQDKNIFVLEMNNEKNRIMGIGLIRNNMFIKKHHIYSNEDYNRYSYIGKYRIDREEMTDDEEIIMKVFDILCFRGARHMKRLKGIKAFPIDMLYNCTTIMDLIDFVSKMFKRRITMAKT